MPFLTNSYTENQTMLENAIGFGKCFDCKKRELTVGGKKAMLYFISTLSSDALLGDLVSRYQSLPNLSDALTVPMLFARLVPYGDAVAETDIDTLSRMILAGASVLLLENLNTAVITDTRSLPSRSAEEPDNDRVLYGARDGFTEILKNNVALLRRRIRSNTLVIYRITVGSVSKTDIALCYDESLADPAYVENIKQKLESIQVDALTVGPQSLAECLIKRRWFNIFPKFRYTERPDTASATLLEGNLIILCDTAPQVMLLPTSIFDFTQESDDYYFPPLIGTYQRFVRMLIFFVTLFFAPFWYLLVTHPSLIPSWLEFIRVDGKPALPIFFQILIVELLLDGLRLASLNTPSTLGSSLSVVAGLILGDFAVDVGWFIPEVILYMAFVAISNFSQPSFELGYAFKFMRIMLLIMVGFFGIVGFVVGTVLIIVIVASNKSVDGSRSYLYPLFPFNGKALLRHLFRFKLNPGNQKKTKK